jgi:hypothetical protein
MQILKAGTLYFALVFGAGFLLGTIRVLWVAPRFGMRLAELMEAPVMLVVTILAARRLSLPPTPAARLGVGLVALGLLLAAEFAAVLWLRGLTISQCLAARDPVAGAVYRVMLGVFAVMPLLVGRK